MGRCTVGHRLRRIRDVLVVLRLALPAAARIRAGPLAADTADASSRAARGARSRPTVISLPVVGAGLVNQHARRVRLRPVLQVVVEERLHDVAAEGQRRSRPGIESARSRGLHDVPGRDSTARARGARARRADRWPPAPRTAPVRRRCPPDRTVPLTISMGTLGGSLARTLIHCLLLPVGIVGGVLGQRAPEAQLIQSAGLGHRPRRAGAEEGLVGIARLPTTSSHRPCEWLPGRRCIAASRPAGTRHCETNHRPSSHRPSGANGTATFNAGCAWTVEMTAVNPSYEPPIVATRPFDSGHVLHQPVDGVVRVGRVIDRPSDSAGRAAAGS